MYIYSILILGGDIIRRRKTCTFLLALAVVVLTFPSIEGEENQFASSDNAKIGLDENKLKVNAGGVLKATKVQPKKYKKVKVWYKKWYKKWYKSHGKWKYKWKYKLKYYWKYVNKYTKASKSKVGAYSVVITSKYVYATAKCSCSLYTDYNHHTRVFYNYNPLTKRWGNLRFEQGPAPKTCPEGMWYDKITDMDFCIIHGKSHDKRGVYLVPYNGVINGIKVVNGYFTTKVVKPPANNKPPTNSTNSTNGTNTTNVIDTNGSNTTDNTNITDSTNETNTTDSTNSTNESGTTESTTETNTAGSSTTETEATDSTKQI